MPKTVTCLIFTALFGLFAALSAQAAGQQNDDYLIDRDVVNAGGARSTSNDYILTGSIGQPLAAGRSDNSLHINFSGFWGGGVHDAPMLYTLTVEKSGSGNGTVTGEGIDCGADCSEQYPEDSSVLLQAHPDLCSRFLEWRIDGVPVSGQLPTVTKDLTVVAVFEYCCPTSFSYVAPLNNAVDRAPDVGLSWDAAAGANVYTVYFGTTSPPPQVTSNLSDTGYEPGPLELNGSYFWKVDAVNSCGMLEGPVWQFTTISIVNQPPEITSTPAALDGPVYVYDVEASDPNGDPLTFSLPVSPESMTIKSTSGEILWEPFIEQVGSHEVEVKVDDGQGGETLQSFMLQVTAAIFDEVYPEVTLSVTPEQILLGESVTIEMSASDNISVTEAEIRVNAESLLQDQGTVIYTPAEAGEYTAYGFAKDGAWNEGMAQQSFWVRGDTATLKIHRGFDAERGASESDPAVFTMLPPSMDFADEAALPGSGSNPFHFGPTVDVHFQYTNRSAVFMPEETVSALFLPGSSYDTVTADDIGELTVWSTGQPVDEHDTVIFLTADGHYFKAGNFQKNPEEWSVTFNYEELHP
ncbi:MAG: hypothetical protein GY801_07035 [bacterium]|nr:hypothetical protein [bacterium]